MSHRKLTDEQEAVLVAEYQGGLTFPKLAAKYAVSFTVVDAALRRAGVKARPAGPPQRLFNGPDGDAVVAAYISGRSQASIAKEFHASHPVISRVLRERHVAARGRLRNRDGHGHWNGGRTVTPAGYVLVSMLTTHPFAAQMRNRMGYCQEHRLVMAQSLGRALMASETVHHINGDRGDNRIENLQLRQGRHGKGEVYICRDCGSHNVHPAPLAED